MIRINLLHVKRKKKVQPIPGILIYGAVALGVIILIAGFLTFLLNGKVSDKKEIKAEREQTLEKLQAQLQVVKNYEADNELYKKKNGVIKQLKKNQDVPLRLFSEVSIHLPDGVWLNSLVDRGSIVDLSGYAFSNSTLVAYVQNLKGSEHLTDVTLLESRQTTFETVPVYKFQLTFKVKA